MYNKNLISQNKTILEALSQINSIGKGPLVLFVIDNNNRMIGTLTDGDIRRALIAGMMLEDKVSVAAHRNFNFLRQDINDNVENLRHQKEMMMKLVPILDDEHHIIEIVDLDKYRSRLPVDAVLMAGGKGVRLRPLTETTPKPLLKVGNKSIIDYNIDSLINFGIKHISVTVNYLKEQLEEHFAEERDDIKINCVSEPEFLGTIGSVQFVPKIYNDVVLVMNSDLFTNINYEDFYLHFKENDADLSVAAVPYSVSVPYGIFDLDGRDVKGIIEKPTYNYYANAGIYLIKRELLETMIPENRFFNATDFIEALIDAGKKVIRFPITGYWIDIGNNQEYAKAQEIGKHLNN